MQLVHTFFKLVLLSETLQLCLHSSLHHSYYKVRSVYYSLLTLWLVQSGPIWILKSITAKKLRRCYKASKTCTIHKFLLLARLLAVRVSFLDSRKTLPNLEVQVDSLANIGLWACMCSTCNCDVVFNLYCICLAIMQFAWTHCPFKGPGWSLRAELAGLLILLITTVTWLLGDRIHSYNPREWLQMYHCQPSGVLYPHYSCRRGWYKQWTQGPGTGYPRTHRDPLSQCSNAYVTVNFHT